MPDQDLKKALDLLRKYSPAFANVSMHWNKERELYLMRLIFPSIFIQEFTQKEIDKGEAEVNDCGSVLSFFKGISKEVGKEFLMIIIPKEKIQQHKEVG